MKASYTVFLCLVLTSACAHISPPEAKPADCAELAAISRQIPQIHYSVHALTPEVQSRSADQLVDLLDPMKLVFNYDDARRIQEEILKMYEQPSGLDCSRLDAVQKLFALRIQESAEFLQSIVGTGLNVTPVARVEKTDGIVRSIPKTLKEKQKRLSEFANRSMATSVAWHMSQEKAKEMLVMSFRRTADEIAARPERMIEWYALALAQAFDSRSSFMSLADVQGVTAGIGVELRFVSGALEVQGLIPGGAGGALREDSSRRPASWFGPGRWDYRLDVRQVLG